MNYNELAVKLLDDPQHDRDAIPCFVSDSSYEAAIEDATVAMIDSYDSSGQLDFYDKEYIGWHYVVPLNVTPKPIEEVSLMSINTQTDSAGNKQSVIINHFAYQHLPIHLQEVSKQTHDLAVAMDSALPSGPEKSAGLRKLLEAKDCFVRASLANQSLFNLLMQYPFT